MGAKKRKLFSRIFRFFLLAVFLLLAGGILFNSCMPFRDTDLKTERYFEKRGAKVRIHHEDYNGTSIRYFEWAPDAASDNKPLLLFVHGAPGSSMDFNRYLADSLLRTRARMINVDRLGYGFSGYGKSAVTLAEQVAQLRFVMARYPGRRAILVGHSFGGPIVAKFAMDYPELTHAIVMLAPVNDPDSEPMFWVSNFARWKATRWMLSKAWQVAGDEKFAHIQQLRLIEHDWQKIRVPVVHIHGLKDWMAPPENLAFSRRHIPGQYLKVIELPKASHFIPWTDYELVRGELMKLMEGE